MQSRDAVQSTTGTDANIRAGNIRDLQKLINEKKTTVKNTRKRKAKNDLARPRQDSNKQQRLTTAAVAVIGVGAIAGAYMLMED